MWSDDRKFDLHFKNLIIDRSKSKRVYEQEKPLVKPKTIKKLIQQLGYRDVVQPDSSPRINLVESIEQGKNPAFGYPYIYFESDKLKFKGLDNIQEYFNNTRSLEYVMDQF